jgi:hypothetical protein
VNRQLVIQTRRSRGVVLPRRMRKTGTRASRTAPAMVKRRATPVSGGMPRRPTRIAAQVVPQIRTSRAMEPQVTEREGVRARSYG